MTLKFTVAEEDVVPYSTGVLDALEQLGYEYEYDETSPADENGDVEFVVAGVTNEN